MLDLWRRQLPFSGAGGFPCKTNQGERTGVCACVFPRGRWWFWRIQILGGSAPSQHPCFMGACQNEGPCWYPLQKTAICLTIHFFWVAPIKYGITPRDIGQTVKFRSHFCDREMYLAVMVQLDLSRADRNTAAGSSSIEFLLGVMFSWGDIYGGAGNPRGCGSNKSG